VLAGIPSYEAGMGVLHGCFCAHPYVQSLLRIKEEEAREFREEIRRSYKANLSGTVRVSLGFYNTEEDVDRLIEALQMISEKEYKGKYKLEPGLGEYLPENFHFNYQDHFDL
jgi:cysteine desulfurase/selenocysteine lyase